MNDWMMKDVVKITFMFNPIKVVEGESTPSPGPLNVFNECLQHDAPQPWSFMTFFKYNTAFETQISVPARTILKPRPFQ